MTVAPFTDERPNWKADPVTQLVPDSRIVFDLGFFDGEDTKTYLNLGYRVIACEANPDLCERGRDVFRDDINNGRLSILNRVVAGHNGTCPFYLNDHTPEWSTANQRMALSGGARPKPIEVAAITIVELVRQYGMPHYVKCDIEGNDSIVSDQLTRLETPPRYVSFELSKENYLQVFASLERAGYRRFQLVNQLNNGQLDYQVQNSSERIRCAASSSGLFGDLLQTQWESLDETLTRYVMFRSLRQTEHTRLALGWLDLHAQLSN